MKNIRDQRGVTITAMIIAVILLIILGSISITAIRSSDKDVLETAYDAKTGSAVASYQEELDIIDVYCASGQISNGEDAEYYIDLFEEKLAANDSFSDADITRKSSTLLRIETTEGYVFYITADGATYAGKSGEITEPDDLESGDITFTLSEEDWTNEDVIVTISLNIDTEATLVYSFDGNSWTEYTDALILEENEKVYACLYSSGVYGTYVSTEVTNIDKLSPNDFSISLEITDSDTIEVSGSTSDQTATSSYGRSGIAYYAFSNDGGSSWEYKGSSSTERSYSFTDLVTDTTYKFAMKAVDNAGNETVSSISSGMIESTPDLTDDDVAFTYDGDWTNDDITVEVTIINSSIQEKIDDGTYTVEYSTDEGTTWEDYSDGIVISENCTIEVRLSNGITSGESVSTEVTNIDKDDPTASIEITSYSTNSISVYATGTDSDSGVATYEFQLSENKASWSSYATYSSSESSYECKYENLTANKTYYVRVVVTDAAGNDIESNVDYTTTGAMPDEEETVSIIDFNYSTTDYTNEDVIVTVTVNGDVADLVEDGTYTIEYSIDGTDWFTYTSSGVTVEKNGSVYIRLSDGTNVGGVATGTVTNIDKLAPTIDDLTKTASTITLKASEASDGTNAESGIVGYLVTSSPSYPSVSSFIDCSDDGEGVDSIEKTVENLLQDTTYYVYVIDYVGNISDYGEIKTESIYVLTDDDVTFTYNKNWTNEDITVSISVTSSIQKTMNSNAYVLQYSIDDGDTWYDYESAFTVTENITIQLRLLDSLDQTGDPYSYSITNIDKINPTISTNLYSSEIKTNGFTLNVGVTDEDSGLSTIVWYYKYSDDEEYTSVTEVYMEMNGEDDGETSATEKSVEITDLVSGTYYAYVEIYDVAGNMISSEDEPITIETDVLEDLTASNTTFTYDPNYWTNGDVSVSIEVTVGGNIQYTLTPDDESSWENYTEAVVVSESGTSLYARVTDGTNSSKYTTTLISNIDTVSPKIVEGMAESDVSTNSFTLSIDVQDEDSGLSSVTWYYKLDDGSYSYVTDTYQEINSEEKGETDLDLKSHIFTEMISGTYTVYAVVADVAGNQTSSEEYSFETEEVVSLTEANIKFTPSTTEWTNEEVSVEVTVTDDELRTLVDNGTMIIQYSKDASSWDSYIDAVSFDTLGTLYVRISDGTNAGDYAYFEVTNIDTLAPSSVTFEVTETLASVISLSITAEDAEASRTSGSSGISSYSYSLDGGSTFSDQTEESEIRITGLDTDTTYTVYVRAYDLAGNYELSSSVSVTTPEGDYVDYSATYEIIEDGDTTNDWRLFYVIEEDDETRGISAAEVTYDENGVMTEFTTTEAGQVYLIASDYILADNAPTTSKGTNVYYSDTWPFSIYLYNVYAQYTGTAYWDSKVKVWNSYYVASYPSSTNSNNKAIQYLLDTDLWGDYADDTLAAYAIGTPTLELWCDAWNAHGYTTLYYDYVSSNGYGVGTTTYVSSTERSLTSSAVENSGYSNGIFFPHTSTSVTIGDTSGSCNGYWLASPSASYSNVVYSVLYGGSIYGLNYGNGYYDVTNAGSYLYSARPIVSLTSNILGTYDVENGVWTLSVKPQNLYTDSDAEADGDGTLLVANIEITYSTVEDTSEEVTVYATLADYLQEYVDSGEWTLQYAIDSVEDEDWNDCTMETDEETDETRAVVTVSENCTIYFRLTDGTNSGTYTTATVNNIVT